LGDLPLGVVVPPPGDWALRGRPLADYALKALVDAGVEVSQSAGAMMPGVPGRIVVLHDAACPLVPADFIARCVDRCRATGEAVVGVRPVTDTVTTIDNGEVGAANDRSRLRQIVSPVVLPATVAEALAGWPVTSIPNLIARIGDLQLVEAPAAAHRVEDAADLALVAALSPI
jgi:2-C-methyl-D-erythritol 4-phosphate cytidylyltransferase